jgi:hypothetical protein
MTWEGARTAEKGKIFALVEILKNSGRSRGLRPCVMYTKPRAEMYGQMPDQELSQSRGADF